MENFETLQEQLHHQKERRSRLNSFWLVFAVAIFASMALPRVAIRVFGTQTYWLALILITLVMTWAGLLLLTQTLYANREIRLIKQQIKFVEKAQRKRKRADRRRWWSLRQQMSQSSSDQSPYFEDDDPHSRNADNN